MDGLIFTPRQADFLKDGSIFAQSPAKTSDAAVKLHLPTAESNRFASLAKCTGNLCSHTQSQTCLPCMPKNTCGSACLFLLLLDSLRSLLGGPTASAFPAPVLHAPRPRLPTFNSHAKLTQAPPSAGSPQLPSFGQDDMAKQIRAKFENLVRASPLPKVPFMNCFVRASCHSLQPVAASAPSLALACRTVCRWWSVWSVHTAFSRLTGVPGLIQMLAGLLHGMHGRHQQAVNHLLAHHGLTNP